MKKLLFIFAIIGCFFACGDDNSKKKLATSGSKTTAKKEIDGSKVYKLNCVVCHGTQGDMGASGAVNLKESKLGVEERISVITNGRNTMQPFRDILSEEQIKAVAEYSMTLTNK